MATDLRAHVRSVRDTGEALRKETASLVTALRKPQVRGSWGETTLKNVAEMAGMVERCDFDLQVTSQSDGQSAAPRHAGQPGRGQARLRRLQGAAERLPRRRRAPRTSSCAGAHLATFARHVRTHVDQLSSASSTGRPPSPPSSSCCSCRARSSSPPRSSRCPTSTSTPSSSDVVLATPDHADRHAPRRLLRLEAGRARRDGRRGVPARPRAPRAARPDGQPLRQARPRDPDHVGQRLQRDRRHRRGHGCSSQARRFRDLQVTEGDLAPLSSVDDAGPADPGAGAGRRRRPGRAHGRARPAAAAAPEAEALWRADPELDELVAGDLERARPDEDNRRRRPRVGSWPSGTPTPTPGSWAGSPSRSRRCSPTGPEVTTDGRLLDVGCGPGVLTAELVRRYGADRVDCDRPDARVRRRLPATGARRRRTPGRGRAAALRRRLLRRRARPAGRPLHEGPGPRADARWRGSPGPAAWSPPASGTTAAAADRSRCSGSARRSSTRRPAATPTPPRRLAPRATSQRLFGEAGLVDVARTASCR